MSSSLTPSDRLLLREINKRLDRIDKTLDIVLRLQTGHNRDELTLEDGTGKVIGVVREDKDDD